MDHHQVRLASSLVLLLVTRRWQMTNASDSLLADYQPLIIPTRLSMLVMGHRANVKCVDYLGGESNLGVSGSRQVCSYRTLESCADQAVVMAHYAFSPRRTDPYGKSWSGTRRGYGIARPRPAGKSPQAQGTGRSGSGLRSKGSVAPLCMGMAGMYTVSLGGQAALCVHLSPFPSYMLQVSPRLTRRHRTQWRPHHMTASYVYGTSKPASKYGHSAGIPSPPCPSHTTIQASCSPPGMSLSFLAHLRPGRILSVRHQADLG